MGKEIKVRIVLRHNTTAGWAEVGEKEVLRKGEIGLEFSQSSNIPKMKIGDGIRPWSGLSYFSANLPESFNWGLLKGTLFEGKTEKIEDGSFAGLIKPAYKDNADISVINKNFDILKTNIEELQNKTSSLSNIYDEIFKEYTTPEGSTSLEMEVKDARIRFQNPEEEGNQEPITYPSAGEAIRAIDYDLYKLSKELTNVVGSAVPTGLHYENNMLQLVADNEPIGDPVEIVGGSGGGSGGGSSFVITLTNLLESRIITVAKGTSVELKFSYTSMDNEEYTDGNGVGTLSVGGIKQLNFSVPQGENTLDITPYLKDGANTVKVQVANSEGSYRSLNYTVNILVLSVTTTSSLMGLYNLESLNFQYTVNGTGTKVVHFILDGEEFYRETLTSTGQSRQILIDRQPDGAHILEIYATADSAGGLITSNIIRAGMIWYSDTTSEPIVLINSAQTSSVQGETITIPYMVFHPHYETADVKLEIIEENENVYSTLNLSINRSAKEWTTQDFPSGNTTFRVTCENVYNEISMNIKASSFDREIYRDNLLFEFNPKGRNNAEDNPEYWEYEGVTASFSNFGWNAIDGWLTDKDGQSILRLLPGSETEFNFKPFQNEPTLTGYTIEVEFATQNVSDYDSIVAQSFNGRGLRIKSQSALLKSEGSLTEVQFKEDSKVRLAFVVEQNVIDGSTGISTSTRLVYIYINGVLCGLQQYSNNDQFSQADPVNLIIGAETCGIDVYFIRFYKNAFSADMELNNYIVDRPTLRERIDKDRANDLLDKNASDPHHKITIDSLGSANRYIIMECPELPQYKGDKKKGMSITYVDPLKPEKSFTATNCQFDVQGTSSAAYPIKNFKIKMNDGVVYTQSGEINKNGFTFTDNSLSSKTLCLKADYASSEHANNVCLVDYYNSLCPYKMPPQEVDERVRQGIYGQPIVLFWKNTDTNEVSFEGMYNMNDDKSNENVFGFKGLDLSEIIPEEEQRIECWEWLNNNTSICLFQNDTDFDITKTDKDGNPYPAWQDSIEPRFPDNDEMYSEVDAIRRAIAWVASTDTLKATNTSLTTPIILQTQDTECDNSKTYYKDKNGTIAQITERGTVISYEDTVSIDRDTFYKAMGATSYAELVGGYEAIYDTETKTWSFRKDGVEVKSGIVALGNYGITLSDSSIQSFAFEYKIVFDGWNTNLYEEYSVDSANYRLAKFKGEFENYFILDAMTFYYLFTEVFLMMDNRAKNMFLTTFDGKHWFPIPYDMDSAIGINNEGQLVLDYNLEDTDYVGDSAVFNGQDSVLWINFRKCFFSKVREMYNTLRSGGEFSYDKIATKMKNHQDEWAEVLWNIDAELKYLIPFYAGSNNLAMAQGNKQTQRDFWLYNAFKYRDSKYESGEAPTNYIHLRIYDKGEIRVTPYSHIYARVEFGNAKDELKRAYRNEEVVFNTDGIAAVNDLEVHIYSSDRISKISDLSPLKVGYCDFSNAPKLQSIIVGSEEEGYSNSNLRNFTLGVSDLLQEINLSNCINLSGTIDASRCPCLETFKAFGTKIEGVTFSNGGRLTTVNLPETLTNLTLRNQSQLQNLNLASYKNISTLFIENTPNVPVEELVLGTPKLDRIRLDGVEWTTENEETLHSFYDKVMTCKGMDTNTQTIDTPYISGRVYIDSISDDFLKLLNKNFPELIVVVNSVPKFFIVYVDNNNTEVYSYIADGGSAAIDPVGQGYINQKDISIPTDTEDTHYYYDGWVNLPTSISKSYIIRVNYNHEFRVRFFSDDDVLYENATQWVRKGNNATDPILTGLIETPTKTPTPQYSYIYLKWNTNLNNILSPKDIKPLFEEKDNYYTVQFCTYGILFPLKEQIVKYGEEANYSESIDGKVYYYINGEPSQYYIFTNWDKPFLIEPEEYISEPIKIIAEFAFNGTIGDTWNTIGENAKLGLIDNYGLGARKDATITLNNTTYTISLELVAKNFDVLSVADSSYNGGSNRAALTFICREVLPIDEKMSDSDKTFEGYTGPTAGGYGNTDLREKLNSTYYNGLQDDLKNIVKEVVKISDKGYIDNPGLRSTNELVWIPSATELSLDGVSSGELFLQDQSSTGEGYPWFSNNETRIKKDINGTAAKYWTRTHRSGLQFRLVDIRPDGSIGSAGSEGLSVRNPAKVLFGVCI